MMAFLPVPNSPMNEQALIAQLLQQQQQSARPPQNEVGQAFFGLGDAITQSLGALGQMEAAQQQQQQLAQLLSGTPTQTGAALPGAGPDALQGIQPAQPGLLPQGALSPEQIEAMVAMGLGPELLKQAVQPPEAFTLGEGDVRFQGGREIARGPAKEPGLSSDGKLARDLNVDLRTPEGRQAVAEFKRASRPGTSVTLKQEGPIPPGHRAERDEQGRIIALTPLPGSPAEAEKRQAEASQRTRQSAAMRRGRGLVRDIDRALALSEGGAGGPVGGTVGANVPGTGVFDLQRQLDSIGTTVSIEVLQQMRDASPTGGALGQVPVQQQQMLAESLGSLDVRQREPVLQQNLRDMREMALDMVFGTDAELDAAAAEGRISVEEARQARQERDELLFDPVGREVTGTGRAGEISQMSADELGALDRSTMSLEELQAASQRWRQIRGQ